MSRRVVITGMAAISTLGRTQEEILQNLKAQKNTTRHMDEWVHIHGLRSHLFATLKDYTPPADLPRKKTRTMSTVSLLAVDCTREALRDAGLEDSEVLTNGRTGVAYGSCSGSLRAMKGCVTLLEDDSTRDMNSTTYIKMMGQTVPVNLSLFFGTKGRLINSSTACTSGSVSIGMAYEAILMGRQDVMIAGGAEACNVVQTAVFDTLFATSTRNDTPEITPAPFDANRDGLVLGEGACTLILEELEHALARGARIYAELVGFGTNTDGSHVTNPNAATMKNAMAEALEIAGLTPDDIGYVSMHGTGTQNGDIAEATATRTIFTTPIPASSLKGYTGHTLGACGALESMVSIMMMREGWFHPNLNLNTLDENCYGVDFITGAGRNIETKYVMNNNFAFGGINTSLIFRKWED